MEKIYKFSVAKNGWTDVGWRANYQKDAEDEYLKGLETQMHEPPKFKIGDIIKASEEIIVYDHHSTIQGTIIGYGNEGKLDFYYIMDIKTGVIFKNFKIFVDRSYNLVQ